VNGVEQPMQVIFDQNLWPVDNKVPFRIGAGAGLAYRGGIDQVRVWSRALSAAEVRRYQSREDLATLARRKQRSAAEQAKLALAFEQQYLPPALQALREAGREAGKAYEKYLATVPTVMVMEEGPAKRRLCAAPGRVRSAGREGQRRRCRAFCRPCRRGRRPTGLSLGAVAGEPGEPADGAGAGEPGSGSRFSAQGL
jgi:hypothetical protein